MNYKEKYYQILEENIDLQERISKMQDEIILLIKERESFNIEACQACRNRKKKVVIMFPKK